MKVFVNEREERIRAIVGKQSTPVGKGGSEEEVNQSDEEEELLWIGRLMEIVGVIRERVEEMEEESVWMIRREREETEREGEERERRKRENRERSEREEKEKREREEREKGSERRGKLQILSLLMMRR